MVRKKKNIKFRGCENSERVLNLLNLLAKNSSLRNAIKNKLLKDDERGEFLRSLNLILRNVPEAKVKELQMNAILFLFLCVISFGIYYYVSHKEHEFNETLNKIKPFFEKSDRITINENTDFQDKSFNLWKQIKKEEEQKTNETTKI